MIDFDTQLVSALETVLPTYYELQLTSSPANGEQKPKVPCISYQEANNYDSSTGDTLGYSHISYTVKIWGNYIADLKRYAKEVDTVLRPLGFKRTASGELHDKNSTMIQKILTYEALASENY